MGRVRGKTRCAVCCSNLFLNQSPSMARCNTALVARDAERWNGTPIPQATIQTAMRSGVREDSPVMASAE